jgi:hypothetical protein
MSVCVNNFYKNIWVSVDAFSGSVCILMSIVHLIFLIFNTMGIEARMLQVHSFDAEKGAEHDYIR